MNDEYFTGGKWFFTLEAQNTSIESRNVTGYEDRRLCHNTYSASKEMLMCFSLHCKDCSNLEKLKEC